MEKYIVSEVVVQLGTSNQGKAFGLLLSNQLEECGFAGNKHTEKFSLVNRLGSGPKGEYYVNFLGPFTEFEEFEVAVKGFLNEFKEDLGSESNTDEFMMLLSDEDEEEIPEFKGYEVLVTRNYEG